jgi:hypothetical protein
MTMNSLADFRRLAVVGARFLRTFPGSETPPVIREITHRQSNAVCFGAEKSWFHFPKASGLRFENGVMQWVRDDGCVLITLEHIAA